MNDTKFTDGLDGLIATIAAILETDRENEVINMRVPGQLKAVLDLLHKKTGITQKDVVCYALQRLYEDRESIADLVDLAREKGVKAAKNALRNAGFSPDRLRFVIKE